MTPFRLISIMLLCGLALGGRIRQRRVKVRQNKRSVSSDKIIHSARSKQACSILCLNEANCVAANFNGSTCEILLEGANAENLTDAVGWAFMPVDSQELVVNLDECVQGPCYNNGTCVDGIASHSCICPSGFRGDNCQIEPLLCQGANPHASVTITASTTHHYYYNPHDSCLDHEWIYDVTYGAWRPATNDNTQWIQADLGEQKYVHSVATRGQPHDHGFVQSNWVKTYKVMLSDDNSNWQTVQDSDNQDMIFEANTDSVTSVENVLPPENFARYVRVNPQTWEGAIVLRWAVFGY